MIDPSNRFLSPQEIVKQFGIVANSQVADFGSGAGDFAIAIAEIVAPKGKVYAIDVLESAHQSLRSLYKIKGITNIELILANLECESGSNLPKESLDLVMIHNIMFQVNNKKNLIQEAYRVIKDSGKLAMIEWDMMSPIGPPKNLRLPEREVLSLIQNNGFVIESKIEAGKYHYGYVFNKV
ncbi:MAG: class I SAM-dependent methyltransferase [Candidatus Paceibacterota bacterium]